MLRCDKPKQRFRTNPHGGPVKHKDRVKYRSIFISDLHLGTKYSNANFLGRKNKYEIATELKKHDVFAWPSLTDTFGLVVLEGMASGLPVAAFRNDVNEYIIEDYISGVLEKDNLEEAIIAASKLNRKDAVARAKEFSWESATDQFLENMK